MNLTLLVWSYLKSKLLNTTLNVLLLSLGVAMITILLLFKYQLEQKISENTRGIDLVVGAKGSPLQLILCNIFHVDFPTGNIKLHEAEKIAKNRLVKQAIPMALGDSYRGFRIVGTTVDYATRYNAQILEGNWWKSNLEVVVGSQVASALKLQVGTTFLSTHALSEGGHAHEGNHLTVTGILTPTGSVIDNLMLTNVETVWVLHDQPIPAPSDPADRSTLVPSVSKYDSSRELTSLLIQYRSAMGAVQLPRIVNGQTSLQAASPAFESARLFSILGVGVEIINGIAYLLVFISALSIFIALYNALRERRYDLAIMRAMGATPAKLFIAVLMEGCALTVLGALTGLALGHIFASALPTFSQEMKFAGITGLMFYPDEWIILLASLLLGVACAIIPAIQVLRTDVSKILAER